MIGDGTRGVTLWCEQAAGGCTRAGLKCAAVWGSSASIETLVASHWTEAYPPTSSPISQRAVNYPQTRACHGAPGLQLRWGVGFRERRERERGQIWIGMQQIAGDRGVTGASPFSTSATPANGTHEDLSRRVEARAMYDIPDGDHEGEWLWAPPAWPNRLSVLTGTTAWWRGGEGSSRRREEAHVEAETLRAASADGARCERATAALISQAFGRRRPSCSMRQANTRLTSHCRRAAQTAFR
ncbi:hypothetical protein K458DRAFT_91117 [Lentithecium fluviatile CBS 122367]|uniref:Uncharacterized protein n=1 Tax=Lentithecium fluviatile CBS 122367 TaxID=1168545 RepID=A0A6G1IR47_9PLEO|nr:hypothetical protein K458DRAFT_91117 [Lentithecium fluviatile CBS 122367]